MVLQRLHGLSDREAVEAFEFDARWKYACGGLAFDHPGFVHTVLVDMRARLARSDRPRRIFEVSLDAARRAGVMSAKRVLDSTPLYDAVATQDTVTLIRSAVRRLLAVADGALEAELRAVLVRDDDYRSAGKPVCDWDDRTARDDLIGGLAADAHACLGVLDGRSVDGDVAEAAELLATVVGQDLESGEGGRFRIAHIVAKDRVISTVDPEARHGRKTQARGFDGYKGHAAVDPDSEIVTDTIVTPGNVGDGAVATDLIDDLIESRCKTQPATQTGGLFSKERFNIDLAAGTVSCPNEITVVIKRRGNGVGEAVFDRHCGTCSLRSECTTAKTGRRIAVGIHEAALANARSRQQDPIWRADYRATRPKVERKLAHLMRRRHGGRRARVRGTTKVDADFNLLAAATNLARLAVLGVRYTPSGWTAAR